MKKTIILVSIVFGILSAISHIHSKQLEAKDALITWAFENANKYEVFERQWFHPENSPQIQFVKIKLNGEKATFCRETVNQWGYTMYGWEYWKPLVTVSDDMKKKSIELIKKTRL